MTTETRRPAGLLWRAEGWESRLTEILEALLSEKCRTAEGILYCGASAACFASELDDLYFHLRDFKERKLRTGAALYPLPARDGVLAQYYNEKEAGAVLFHPGSFALPAGLFSHRSGTELSERELRERQIFFSALLLRVWGVVSTTLGASDAVRGLVSRQ